MNIKDHDRVVYMYYKLPAYNITRIILNTKNKSNEKRNHHRAVCLHMQRSVLETAKGRN